MHVLRPEGEESRQWDVVSILSLEKSLKRSLLLWNSIMTKWLVGWRYFCGGCAIQ